MPYRRLPNTDAARLKAMRIAISLSMKKSPIDLAYNQQTLLRVKSFLPVFEQSINRQKQAFKTQVERSKQYLDLKEKARLYISHFFQVMNLMIQRNELPEETREFYDIQKSNKSIPLLNTDQELLDWGKKLIDGDQNRQRAGGKMITNPTAAVVRVHYEQFKHAFFYQKDLQKINNNSLQKIATFRTEADDIILTIWNQIESHFAEESNEDTRREKCSEYGIAYVFRPSERKKIHTDKLAETRQKRLLAELSSENQDSDVLTSDFSMTPLFFNEN